MSALTSFSQIRRLLPLLILALSISCVKEIAVTSINVTPESVEMYQGEKRFAEAKIRPSKATEQTVQWKSDNEPDATVNGEGLITAVGLGTASISASAGGQTGYCKVTVVKGAVLVTSISLDVVAHFHHIEGIFLLFFRCLVVLKLDSSELSIRSRMVSFNRL